jgi:hypothetical protein
MLKTGEFEVLGDNAGSGMALADTRSWTPGLRFQVAGWTMVRAFPDPA